jgi:phage tail-like protein
MMTMPPPPAPPHDPFHLLVGERLGFRGLDGTTEPAPLTLERVNAPAEAPQPPCCAPPQPFIPRRVWRSDEIDSRIAGCLWHRYVVAYRKPPPTSLWIESRTSDFALTDDELADDAGWLRLPALPEGCGELQRTEALFANEPGRYLWLRVTLIGVASIGPEIQSIDIEYPRLTTLRYLPGIFSEDPRGAAFTERLLSIFDTTHRSIEAIVDDQARLFDAESAPATSSVRGRPDFLSFIASWVGISLDGSMPEAARRRLVQGVGRVGALRGTPRGIRELLVSLLGMQCSDAPLLLEHFKVRRWLFAGHGRLGEAAELWGEQVVNRSSLGHTARVGVTQTITTGDPLHDPFQVDAHRFTAFLPCSLAATQSHRRTVERLIESEKPAHTEACLVYVSPRMRIGIQSMIGLDAVIARLPDAVRLDGAALGQGTIVGGSTAAEVGIAEIGHDSRVGQSSRLA